MGLKKILRSPTSTNRARKHNLLLETTSAVYLSLVSVKKLPDYAALEKGVDSKIPDVYAASKPLSDRGA